jgi:hypothetical protein
MKIESPSTQDSTPIVFSAEMMAEIHAVIAMFPEGKSKSAIIRILHIVQTNYGWTSVSAMNTVAEILNIQPTIRGYAIRCWHIPSLRINCRIIQKKYSLSYCIIRFFATFGHQASELWFINQVPEHVGFNDKINEF